MKATCSSAFNYIRNYSHGQVNYKFSRRLIIVLYSRQIIFNFHRDVDPANIRHLFQILVTRWRENSGKNWNLNSNLSTIFHEVYKNFRLEAYLRYDKICARLYL